MMALKEQISHHGWTQADAAARFGVTQPRVSDLMRGKINLFALDALVNMAVAAGLHIEMRVREAAKTCLPAGRKVGGPLDLEFRFIRKCHVFPARMTWRSHVHVKIADMGEPCN